MKYGLIGEKLAYSHSPAIHGMLADYEYGLYPLTPGELPAFLGREDIGGLNVTIPYKREVLPYCDELTDKARRIGSVNTLVYDAQRRILGDNTDYDGFLYMLGRAGITLAGKKVVLLGSGGASLAARAAAEDAGAREVVTISRAGENNYENLAWHADAEVLVNCTPVGTFPNLGECPVSLDAFPQLTGVADLIYNPLRSRLVLLAMERGIPATGGLAMLVAQARAAAERFTGRPIPAQRTEEVLAAMTKKLENVVLIGMPGAGKTTVGGAVAQQLGRPFFDTDAMVVEQAGMPIPDIFRLDGEPGFRARERAALIDAAREGGRVIATGGGAPLFLENQRLLRQNGRIFFLTRALEKLPTEGRPLSTDLNAMYEARMPVYRAFADVAVDNNDGAADQTAGHILRAL